MKKTFKIVNYFHEKFNYWYCQDCNKYHSGRIKNFNTYDDTIDGFCQKESADEALTEIS